MLGLHPKPSPISDECLLECVIIVVFSLFVTSVAGLVQMIGTQRSIIHPGSRFLAPLDPMIYIFGRIENDLDVEFENAL